MNAYQFGPFRLDAAQGLLSTSAGEITLPPKAFDTLRVLVESAGVVLTKRELLDRVWPDTFVDENNLAQNISLVRKALGNVDPSVEDVQTIPRRGYRFVANVVECGETATSETDGCAASACSTSIVAMFSPPEMITSLRRSRSST